MIRPFMSSILWSWFNLTVTLYELICVTPEKNHHRKPGSALRSIPFKVRVLPQRFASEDSTDPSELCFTQPLNKPSFFPARKDPRSKNESHLPILLFTLPLVLSESSSRPLGYILGAVAGRGARGGIVGGGLPWDINCRFSSARRGRPLLSVRLGVNMQSGRSKRGRGGSQRGRRRLGRGEGGGRWWDGGDFGGGYGSKRPRCLIVSHARRGSDFGCNSRGNGHRLNYFCRFSLCEDEEQKKKHTKPHQTHAHSSAGIFTALRGDNLPSVKPRSTDASVTETAAMKRMEKEKNPEPCILGKGMIQACTINMKSHDANSSQHIQNRHPTNQIQDKPKNHSIAKPTG